MGSFLVNLRLLQAVSTSSREPLYTKTASVWQPYTWPKFLVHLLGPLSLPTIGEPIFEGALPYFLTWRTPRKVFSLEGRIKLLYESKYFVNGTIGTIICDKGNILASFLEFLGPLCPLLLGRMLCFVSPLVRRVHVFT